MANHYPDLQNCGWEWLSWGNWWLSRGKFLTLQLNPAMRGASEEEHTGYWVVRLHTERRLLTLYFLAIRNLRNFEFATKDEAIVDAPWVRLCASCFSIIVVVQEDFAYSYYAGWFYHCSFCCNGSLRASNSGMSRVWLPLFFLYDIKTAIMESDGCESDRPMITKRPFSVYYGR